MSWNSHAQEIRKEGKEIPAENKETTEIAEPKPDDTLKVLIQEPVKAVENDTNKKNGAINDIIKRKASKYEGYDMRTNIGTLYDNAEIEYQDMQLKAGVIKYNKVTNEVFAGRMKDSTGAYSQYPYFKQGSQVIEADSIHFNTITKKARVWNTRTDQGEFRVKGEITKKENDSTYYIKNAHFTTSKDIENPDYEFRTDKIKLVPNKKVVVGTTVMWIQDVPTPIILPFGYFPMTKEAESGFIVPTFGDNNNQGYFLQNGGYYFAISDYMDLAVTGDYYTNGSYGLRGQSNYAKRYKFRGNVNVRFENIVQSERGFPDYSRARQYNIQWSHSQDSKANPNSRFSASVNLGSSQYFRQSLNTVNVGSSLNNTLSSSISYSKTFQTVPQVNLSLTARHSQNTNTESITMSLPTLQASVDRIFPFASADEPKKGFIKNINLQYNLRGENSVNTTDSLFFKPQMFKDMRTGLQHSIPISTNFKVFKYFSVSAGTNFQETWVLNTINRQYNPTSGKVETTDLKGFDSYRTYNFTSSIGTTIYGTFNFNPDGKIQAIRHVIRPSVSYNYTPSFDQYYDTYNTDATQNENYEKYYSRFEGGLFGAPGRNTSNSIGLGVNNTFEAKMRNDDETSDEPKKVMLLNNLNFTTNYNIAADSLAWSPLRITGGTALFNQKLNVNFGASLDPYALDNSGTRIDTYNINNGGSLFRLTNANLTLGYSFTSRGDSGSKKNSDNQTARNGGREDDLFGTGTDMGDQRQSMFSEDEEDKPDKAGGTFFNAVIPFDLRLAYSLNYNNSRRQKEITGNSLMVSGNIDITPKWKMGFSTGYDFVNNGITFTQLRFERDLSSWRMDFNWVPNGYNKYWSFFIGIKSSVLSDIKWDKRQVPDRTVGN